MSKETEDKPGMNRRRFLGASALTGAGVAMLGTAGIGSAVMSRESWAAAVS